MHVLVVAAGKTRCSPLQTSYADYLKRISNYTRVEPVENPASWGAKSERQSLLAESQGLLQAIPSQSNAVPATSGGTAYTSREFLLPPFTLPYDPEQRVLSRGGLSCCQLEHEISC